MEITYEWEDDFANIWHIVYTVPEGSNPDMLEAEAESLCTTDPIFYKVS